MSKLRLVMMGTGPFAVPTFQSLLESTHDVVALVTRPTPPARGRKPAPISPMRRAAPPNLPLLDPPDINAESARRQLADFAAELLIVCDYGQILSQQTLGLTPLGGINLHGSLLPKYRGAAPVHRALLQGDTETGVSVIHMTPRLDAGPCLVQRRTEIEPEEDAEQLEARLAQLGVPAVHEALELLAAWDRKSPLGTPQDPQRASRAPRLSKREGEVDWNLPAAHIRNQVRAFKPWPGTYTYWRSGAGGEPQRLILDAVELPPEDEATHNSDGGARPGEVVVAEGRLLVATGQGVLSITRIQPAGKRVMSVDEFLRGHHFPPGARLG